MFNESVEIRTRWILVLRGRLLSLCTLRAAAAAAAAAAAVGAAFQAAVAVIGLVAALLLAMVATIQPAAPQWRQRPSVGRATGVKEAAGVEATAVAVAGRRWRHDVRRTTCLERWMVGSGRWAVGGG